MGLVVFDSPPLLQQEDVEQLVRSASMTEWIALVAPFSQESVAFQTFLLAAFYDYHTLPIDLHRLLLTIGRAHGKSLLRLSLRKKRGEEPYRLGMLGDSSGMRAFFMQLEKTIEVDCPVLIGGETGTGKELVAQAIHKHSKRSGGPFVVINCGAIPENLIQSELFGHEKGARLVISPYFSRLTCCDLYRSERLPGSVQRRSFRSIAGSLRQPTSTCRKRFGSDAFARTCTTA